MRILAVLSVVLFAGCVSTGRGIVYTERVQVNKDTSVSVKATDKGAGAVRVKTGVSSHSVDLWKLLK